MGNERAKHTKSGLNKTMKNTRSFTAIQKETAVNRVLVMNEQKSKVARDMGVPESTLRGWCKDPEKIRRLAEQSKRSLLPAASTSQQTMEQSSPSTSKYIHTPLFPLTTEFLNSEQFTINNNNNRIESFHSEIPRSKQNKADDDSPVENLDDSQKENETMVNNVSEPEDLSSNKSTNNHFGSSLDMSDSQQPSTSYNLPPIPDSIRELLQPTLDEFFTKLSDPQYTPFFISTLKPYLMSIESNYRATKIFQRYLRSYSSDMQNKRSILDVAGLASIDAKQCCSNDRNLQEMTATAIESLTTQILNHFTYLNLQEMTPTISMRIFMTLHYLMQIIQAEYPHLPNL